MPFIRSLVSKYYAYIVTLILLLGVIIPTYSHYTEKKLVYITIAAPFSCQPSSCSKCIKANMRLFYNIYSVSDTECAFLACLYNL